MHLPISAAPISANSRSVPNRAFSYPVAARGHQTR